MSEGYGVEESKFEAKVNLAVDRLRRTVLRYLSAASNLDGPYCQPRSCKVVMLICCLDDELTVVLSPVLTSRREDKGSGISGTSSYIIPDKD